jgi:hypothetical protein
MVATPRSCRPAALLAAHAGPRHGHLCKQGQLRPLSFRRARRRRLHAADPQLQQHAGKLQLPRAHARRQPAAGSRDANGDQHCAGGWHADFPFFEARAGERYFLNVLDASSTSSSGAARAVAQWKLLDPLGRTVFQRSAMGVASVAFDHVDSASGQIIYRHSLRGVDQETPELLLPAAIRW